MSSSRGADGLAIEIAPGGPAGHEVRLRGLGIGATWTRAGGSGGGRSRLQARFQPPARSAMRLRRAVIH